MKISARNQLAGVVKSVDPGAINTEVTVSLAGGEEISSIITNASVANLAIQPQLQVLVVVKASSVMLMTPGDVQLSARNQLQGVVKDVHVGSVNTEVVVELPGGTEMVSIITRRAVEALGLQPGVRVVCVIKASNVLLAVSS